MREPLFPTDVLDLAQIDPQSLLIRAQTLAQQVNPRWTDFSSNFPENILLNSAAALFGAVAIHNINERARQLTESQMTERISALRLAAGERFTLTGRTAAQLTGTFSLPNGALATRTITLPAGFRVAAGSYVHTLLAEAVITVGSNQAVGVTLEQAEWQEEVLAIQDDANPVAILSFAPLIEASVEVTAADGTYSRVDGDGVAYRSFLDMGPTTRGYILQVDDAGVGRLLFGNGINGAKPQGSSITVSYKTGGGEDGRVTTGYTGWKVLDQATDSDGNPVTVQFANTSDSVGGTDEMTVEEAKVLLPRSRYLVKSCSNEAQYEQVALETAGIARAAMLTSEHDPSIQENRGRLYIVAYGSPYSDSGYYPAAAPTAAQLATVQAAIAETGAYPEQMRFVTDVLSGQFTAIDVSVKIYKRANYTAAAARADVVKEIRKFFAVSNEEKALNSQINFGYKITDADGNSIPEVAWGLVFNAIQDAPSIRKVSEASDGLLLNNQRLSVSIESYIFPIPGTIRVYDMDQGGIEI